MSLRFRDRGSGGSGGCWWGSSRGECCSESGRPGQALLVPALGLLQIGFYSRPYKAHVILVLSIPKGGILSSFIFFIPCPGKGVGNTVCTHTHTHTPTPPARDPLTALVLGVFSLTTHTV